MPISLDSPLAADDVSHTSGATTFEKPLRKPATFLETPSASARAMRLGTNSPTTMEKNETMRVMMTVAMPSAAGIPKPTSTFASGSERLVAANADEKKPTSVMATWIVARNEPESAARSAARRAALSPSSASCSSTERLAVVSAASDIEKYPLARVSRNVTMIGMAISMRGSATSLAVLSYNTSMIAEPDHAHSVCNVLCERIVTITCIFA